jgi:hypothetical protein
MHWATFSKAQVSARENSLAQHWDFLNGNIHRDGLDFLNSVHA